MICVSLVTCHVSLVTFSNAFQSSISATITSTYPQLIATSYTLPCGRLSTAKLDKPSATAPVTTTQTLTPAKQRCHIDQIRTTLTRKPREKNIITASLWER